MKFGKQLKRISRVKIPAGLLLVPVGPPTDMGYALDTIFLRENAVHHIHRVSLVNSAVSDAKWDRKEAEAAIKELVKANYFTEYNNWLIATEEWLKRYE